MNWTLLFLHYSISLAVAAVVCDPDYVIYLCLMRDRPFIIISVVCSTVFYLVGGGGGCLFSSKAL